MKKPKIRFNGFNDDWEQRKLGEVADIVGGGTPSTNVSNYWDGNIDWYAPAEISDQIFLSSSQRKITEKGYNNSSAKMLPIGTVLFTSRAGIGKTAILSKKGCTNQGFQSIVPHKDELDSYFIFSRTDELKRYGEIVGAGSTFVEVSGKQMANIEMMMPKTISEQKVIGAYFAKLDHLITLHQRKCDEIKKLKKYMLQNMFPQDEEKVPKIRFYGFTDDWEQRKFGSLLNEIREKTTIENEDTLLSCAIDGMYLNSELFSHFRGQSNIGYLKVKKNDLILSAQNLHLGNCNVNLRFEHGIISPAYKVYELVDCNPLFVQAWIKMDKTKDFFLKSSTEGASVCRKNILWEELYKQELVVPAIEEQTVIGTYFEQFDQLITLHQCKSNFCKKNEVNAWEQRKLGKIVEVHNGKDYKHLEKGNIPVYGTGGYMLSVSESLSDTQDAIGIGRKGTIDKPYILRAPFWTVDTLFYCIPREENDLNFIFDIFQNINWRLMDESTGVPSLSKKSINNVKILVPNKKEQKQIGLYFNQLDHLITLHQWECNINENTEGNDEKQRKPIKKLIISEGNLSLVDDMFLLHRMTFLVCNKYILLRLNVVKYKITIIIISNILYSIVSLLIIACYLIVINKQLIILIYVEISVVIIKGDDDYARIRS